LQNIKKTLRTRFCGFDGDYDNDDDNDDDDYDYYYSYYFLNPQY